MWSLLGVAKLREMLEERRPVLLIDLRDPEDYLSGHIPGAVCAQEPKLPELLADQNGTPAILICYHGPGSIRTARSLSGRGFSAAAVCGGMNAWMQAGYPVVSG